MIEKLEQTYKSGTPMYETVIKINEIIDVLNDHNHTGLTTMNLSDFAIKTAPAGE